MHEASGEGAMSDQALLLSVLARRRSRLHRFALGLLVFVATLLAALTGGSAQKVESVRLATLNAYPRPPIFKCANAIFADCLPQISGEAEAQAGHLTDTILKDTDCFDIIAINETWDEDAKKA
jgi:hypothetical protein